MQPWDRADHFQRWGGARVRVMVRPRPRVRELRVHEQGRDPVAFLLQPS